MLAKSGRRSPSKSAIAKGRPGRSEVAGLLWVPAASAELQPAKPKRNKEIHRNAPRNARRLSLSSVRQHNLRTMSDNQDPQMLPTTTEYTIRSVHQRSRDPSTLQKSNGSRYSENQDLHAERPKPRTVSGDNPRESARACPILSASSCRTWDAASRHRRFLRSSQPLRFSAVVPFRTRNRISANAGF